MRQLISPASATPVMGERAGRQRHGWRWTWSHPEDQPHHHGGGDGRRRRSVNPAHHSPGCGDRNSARRSCLKCPVIQTLTFSGNGQPVSGQRERATRRWPVRRRSNPVRAGRIRVRGRSGQRRQQHLRWRARPAAEARSPIPARPCPSAPRVPGPAAVDRPSPSPGASGRWPACRPHRTSSHHRKPLRRNVLARQHRQSATPRWRPGCA